MTYTTTNGWTIPTATATYSVGFDSIFDRLERLNTQQAAPKYPPHNVVKHSEESFEIAVAVAGFTEDDLLVELEDRTLTIASDLESDNDLEYIHKGIATRKFKKAFELGEFIEVKEVSLVNGILSVFLEKNVPEEQKPKRFNINNTKEFLTE